MKVTSGEHKGKVGTIERIYAYNREPYAMVQQSDGTIFGVPAKLLKEA